MQRKALLVFRIAAVMISLFGMGYRLIYAPLTSGDLSQFFDMLGYFTIQSGLLVLYVFLLLLINQLRGRPEKAVSPILRGAALLYILITSLIYLTLLDGMTEKGGLNTLVLYINHLGTALLLLTDHLLTVPRYTYRWSVIPLWLIYPLVYLSVSIAEGLLFSHFRYYFLNFRELGLPAYLLFVILLLAVFAGVSALIVLINRLPERNTTE